MVMMVRVMSGLSHPSTFLPFSLLCGMPLCAHHLALIPLTLRKHLLPLGLADGRACCPFLQFTTHRRQTSAKH